MFSYTFLAIVVLSVLFAVDYFHLNLFSFSNGAIPSALKTYLSTPNLKFCVINNDGSCPLPSFLNSFYIHLPSNPISSTCSLLCASFGKGQSNTVNDVSSWFSRFY